MSLLSGVKALNRRSIDGFTSSASLVLVLGYKYDCNACNAMHKVMSSIAKSHRDISVGDIEVTENRWFIDKYDLCVVPTVLIFKNGKYVQRLDSLRREEEIIELALGLRAPLHSFMKSIMVT